MFCIELKAGPASINEMSEFQLDVNDFNDIANGCNGCGLPACVFHVQINDEYLPPTRRSVARNLWWTAVRQRRGEDKRAGYYKPSAFRTREEFAEELRTGGYAGLTERLRANRISLI